MDFYRKPELQKYEKAETQWEVTGIIKRADGEEVLMVRTNLVEIKLDVAERQTERSIGG